MKLSEIYDLEAQRDFLCKGYKIPSYNRDTVIKNTTANPTWVHFGTGNIFRAFPAAVLDTLLENGICDRGVIAVEGFDYEIIDKAYKPFDNLSLLVTLKGDGCIDKRVVAAVTESLTADTADEASFNRLKEIFVNESLQMVSFTITEKGYSLNGPDGNISGVVRDDFDNNCFPPKHLMGKITYLLNERYKNGASKVAMVSMDNCSHNGDKLKSAVLEYAKHWKEAGLVEEGFVDYLMDEEQVSFPLSMIDKITPRPDQEIVDLLKKDGFEDAEVIITSKNTYTSAFVNAEETQYLVVEDKFPNGRPALEKGGIYFTDRETVDKVEKMKVCTCLNPLHTALAIFGCLLGYKTIWEEMKDDDLRNLITQMGYNEGMPVVVDPKIIKPESFIDEVLNLRLPNPFMPDTPQRIATDTSQKLPIRFGETLKAYIAKGEDVTKLRYIPIVLAGYLKYLTGIDDDGKEFALSSDPLLDELTRVMAVYKDGHAANAEELRPILGREDIFAVDLYESGLAEKITAIFNDMNKNPGSVRRALNEA